MRKSTQELRELIESDEFGLLRIYLQPFLEKQNLGVLEREQEDYLQSLDSSRERVSLMIDKGVYELAPHNKRQTISQYFSAIRDRITVFKNSGFNEAEIRPIYDLIDRLESAIFDIRTIDSYSERYESTLKSELNSIRKIRDELKAATAKISAFHETEKKLDTLVGKTEGLDRFSTTVLDSIKKKEESAVSILNGIREREQSFGKIEESLNAKKGNIEVFAGTVESQETKIADLVIRSEKLIAEHEEKDKRINEQLNKATGTGLFRDFGEAKAKYQKRETFALALFLGGIIYFGAGSFMLANYTVGEFEKLGTKYIATATGSAIANSTIEDKTKPDTYLVILGLLLRILALGPALYLVFFLKKQHSRMQDLAEAYSFKSIISLSLPNYQELMEKSDKESVIQVTASAIDKIFKEPKAEADKGIDVEKTLDAGIELTGKAVDLVKKIKKE